MPIQINSNLGNREVGHTLTFYAHTQDGTGAEVDASAGPSYRLYEEETATPLLTGSMAVLDTANTTGFYSEQITLSSANGFENDKDYCILVTATVSGVASGAIYSFRMGTVPADVIEISGDATAADNLETMLDGTGGQALTLGQLRVNSSAAGGAVDIDNSAGPAISARTSSGVATESVSTGGNGAGIAATGDGTGHGLLCTGGATGDGLRALGGATSGDGVHAEAQTSGDGIEAVGKSAGRGFLGTGGATGEGARFAGGSTSGAGLLCIANGSGNGITATGVGGAGMAASGQGANAGILATGGATGDGLRLLGGATSGDGIHAEAQTLGDGIDGVGKGAAGIGLKVTGGTDAAGLSAIGAGTGQGILATGGATGDGIRALGGATSGDGFHMEAQTAGDGLQAVGAGGGLPYNPAMGTPPLVSGTSDSGTTLTMVDAARTEADTDYWKGAYILFTSGNISGQTRLITGFNAATDTITFTPATTQAVATQNYEILPNGGVDLWMWRGATPNALNTGRVDVLVGAMDPNVITATVIAADAIGASELAADAVAEIQAGLATSAAVAAIQADTDDIQARLPATLNGGRMRSHVEAMDAGVITATVIAADAIGASELAADAVAEIADQVWDEILSGHLGVGSTGEALAAAAAGGSPGAIADAVWDELRAGHVVAGSFGEGVASVQGNVTGSVGSVTGNVGGNIVGNVNGNVVGSVGSVAAGGITAASIATDAIDSDAIAASAVTEIQAGLATSAAVAAVQADTDDIQARLPATLSGGRMRSQVEGMDAGTVTAAAVATDAIDADALAADAVNEIADQVWNEPTVGHNTVGTFGQVLFPIRAGTATAGAATTITLDAGASAVDDYYVGMLVYWTSGTGDMQARSITDYVGATKVATVSPAWAVNPGAGTVFVILPEPTVTGSTSTPADVADAVWDELRAGHVIAGSFGEGVASVQGNVTGSVGSVTGNVGGNVVGNVNGNVVGSVGSVAAGGITAASIATNAIDADALATDAVNEIVDQVWDELIAGHLGVGSTGEALAAAAAGGSPGAIADAVWDELRAGHVAAGSFGEYVLADVVRISGDVTPADNLEAAFETGGTNTVTMRLAQLSVVNSAGDAIVASSTGSNGHGLNASGNGSGDGIRATGGATNDSTGIRGTSAATNGYGIMGVGLGTRSGIRGVGGATGHGIHGFGGTTSGHGILGQGNANGSGLRGIGGGTAGNSGIVGESGPAGHGIHGFGDAAGDGIRGVAGATGHGLHALGGSTSGDGIHAIAQTSGDGIEAQGAGGGFDINADIQGSLSGSVASVTGNVGGNVVGSVGSVALNGITAGSLDSSAVNEIVDQTWDEILAGHLGAGSTGEALNNAAAGGATPGAIADAVWDEATSGHLTSGTFGQAQNAIRANTAQGGGATTITLDAGASAIDDFYNFTLIFVTGGTGAGQSRMISDYVGATKVATVNTAWGTNPDATSVFVILPFGSIPGAVAPSAADNANAVWDELTAEGRALGSYGQLLKDDIDATISSRASAAALAVVQADTDDLQARVPATLNGGRMRSHVEAIDAGPVNQIVDQNWDEILAGHLAVGSTGEALNDAAAGGGGGGGGATAAQVWDEPKSAHQNPNTMGNIASDVDALEFTGNEG